LSHLIQESIIYCMNELLEEAIDLLSVVILGRPETISIGLATLLARGHLLLEDLPGTGKTTFALALARVMGCSFARVQFTNDLMPSDVVGTEIPLPQEGRFTFNKGPVFNNILLADEINRATPRTQSALLEAMGEGRVTVGGKTYHLPEPFFVIATQNPLELYGTFPLPESQLDRFMTRMEMGYPGRELEAQLVSHDGHYERARELPAVLTVDRLLEAQKAVDNVKVDEKILSYLIDIAQWSRDAHRFRFGLSTRGVISIKKMAQAVAYLSGRDYVVPDDVKVVFPYVAYHRLVPPGEYEGADRMEYLNHFISSVPLPL
jgi:MoxR-like ATPase